MSEALSRAFPWILLTLAVVVPILSHRKRAKDQEQLSWTCVPGVIVSSRLELYDDAYFPEVKYRYRLHGRQYVGDVIRTGEIFLNFGTLAKEAVERYPVGCEVNVYVDPKHPWSPVLEPGGESARLFQAYCISVFCVIGACIAFFR